MTHDDDLSNHLRGYAREDEKETGEPRTEGERERERGMV